MQTNRDQKTYPGGIRNKISHISVKIGGSTVIAQDLRANQDVAAHTVITRYRDPVDRRDQTDTLKDSDV